MRVVYGLKTAYPDFIKLIHTHKTFIYIKTFLFISIVFARSLQLIAVQCWT